MTKQAVVYSRVSTDEQLEGTSLDTQVEACLRLARDRGYEVPEAYIIREQFSGATLRRPGLDRAREMVESGLASAVVFYHVDRLSRDAVDLMILLREFGRHSAEALAVREPPEDTTLGRAFTFLRGTFSELERREIAERTMRGKRARAREGRLVQGTGAGIYGYHYDPATKTRTVNEPQAEVVRRLFAMAVDNCSINGIATTLNAEGVTTLTDKRWHPLTVRRLLTNTAYMGVTYYGRTRRTSRSRTEEQPQDEWIEVTGATPAIVPPELYKAAQATLTRPGRRRQNAARKYLLSGRTRCGVCGGRLTGSVLSGRYFYYYCRRNRKHYGGNCTLRYQRAEPLETAVWDAVREILLHPEIVAAEVRDRKQAAAPHLSTEPAKLERQISKIKGAEARLLRAYAFEDVDAAMLQTELRRVRRDREALEARLSDLRHQLAEIERLATAELTLTEACERVRANVDGLDFEGRRLALEALDIEVTVWPDMAEMRGLLPTTSIPNSHADVCAMVMER
jgi:site-specific DNA recombinase